jgi:hypothetical protein
MTFSAGRIRVSSYVGRRDNESIATNLSQPGRETYDVHASGVDDVAATWSGDTEKPVLKFRPQIVCRWKSRLSFDIISVFLA